MIEKTSTWQPRLFSPSRTLSLLALAAVGGCASATTPRPAVYYTIDAPLCGMKLGVVFSIDQRVVGTDTFVVHLAGEHVTSGPFATSVGQHVLSARSVNGYIWPDRTVNLAAGAAFTASLSFYCS
jgi:hypothetical protein